MVSFNISIFASSISQISFTGCSRKTAAKASKAPAHIQVVVPGVLKNLLCGKEVLDKELLNKDPDRWYNLELCEEKENLEQEMDLIKAKLDVEVKQKVGFKSEWWL